MVAIPMVSALQVSSPMTSPAAILPSTPWPPPLSEDGESFEIIDLFGGQDDLANRIIRCVGDPHTRLTEDALRVLRGVRFAVRLGFDIHPDTKTALRDCGHGLARISRERVSTELQGILLSRDPERGISLLTELELLNHVLPCGISPRGMGNLQGLPADFTLRCASLLWQMPTDELDQNLKSLKLSNHMADHIRTLASGSIPDTVTPRAARALRHSYGDLALPLLSVAASHGTATAELQTLVKASEMAGDCVRISGLDIDGQDLLALGIKGRAVKEALNALLSFVLDHPEKNTKELLIKELQMRIS